MDYPEFVVYDNRRSMIEYIVTFDEVAYRAPPSRYNFYTSQVPSLYKVEPIVLPIPEEELDKLYMLGPDTGEFCPCLPPAYCAPPTMCNFYTSQVPSLYKVEPIVLPIPEEELNKLCMLGPDTGEFCPCLPSAYCAPCTSLRKSSTSSTCWARTQVSFAPAFPLRTVPHVHH